jgi:hypothetical protein
VTVARNEILTALNEPDAFVLALVQVNDGLRTGRRDLGYDGLNRADRRVLAAVSRFMRLRGAIRIATAPTDLL